MTDATTPADSPTKKGAKELFSKGTCAILMILVKELSMKTRIVKDMREAMIKV